MGVILLIPLLEITLRLTGRVTAPLVLENVNGDFLYKPHTKGIWIRGLDADLISNFSINATGWNCKRDFNFDAPKEYIALIGDSYIESLHVPSDSSIGRKIEALDTSVIVHEYGRSGCGGKDFADVYQKFCKGKYSKIFVLITEKDLMETQNSIIGRGQLVPTQSKIRQLYASSALLTYLNVQGSFLIAVSKVFSFEKKGNHAVKNQAETSTQSQASTIATDSLITYFAQFDSTVQFLYEPDRLYKPTIEVLAHRGIKIEHELRPYNFGFDSHWNNFGRWNVAKTIARKLKKK